MRLLPWVYPLLFHLRPLSKQVSLPSAPNQRLTQYCLYQGCQNPVLKGQNPARFYVLPGRKQLSSRKVRTQLKGLTKWEVTKPGSWELGSDTPANESYAYCSFQRDVIVQFKDRMGVSHWSPPLRSLHLVVMNSLRLHSCAISLSRSFISALYWVRSFRAFSFNKIILDWASALNYKNNTLFTVNEIWVLVSNLTCHHKQQWNNSQLQRSFCVGHEVPIYNIKNHILSHKLMLKTKRLKQISGPTFPSLFRSCWKRICSTWRVCSSFLRSLFFVSCSPKWAKAWIIKGRTQSTW